MAYPSPKCSRIQKALLSGILVFKKWKNIAANNQRFLYNVDKNFEIRRKNFTPYPY